MSSTEITRAWKDAAYRNSLSETQRAALPLHPSGLMELDPSDSDAASGGVNFSTIAFCGKSWQAYTFGCCHGDPGPE